MGAIDIVIIVSVVLMLGIAGYFVYLVFFDKSNKDLDNLISSKKKESKEPSNTNLEAADLENQSVGSIDKKEVEEKNVIKKWDEGSKTFIYYKFNRSFIARLIQSSDEIKLYYSFLKNEILSYKNVNSKISWKHEIFRVGKASVILIRIKGKKLCLYFDLDTQDYIDSKYKVEFQTNSQIKKELTCLYRVNNSLRCSYAKELIQIVMKKYGIGKEYNSTYNYASQFPFEDNDTLVQKGLIRLKKMTKK
ncbi:MAG: hypothetical protein SOW55_00995 [Bacilli bacterium]|nr:hypothetical protein [Bacillales bacterium]MDY2574550.1 hypothetical protein [Bacilli bacterium]